MKEYEINTCVRGANIHIYPSPFKFQSRILKITKTLADSNIFDRIVIIMVLAKGLMQHETLDDKREIVRIRQIFGENSTNIFWKAAGALEWSCRILWEFRNMKVACVNCHGLTVLPLCFILRILKHSKLVYDTHELETETVGRDGLRKLLSKIVERCFIRFANETIVVNNSIAEWYQRKYVLKNVSVVKNVPYEQEGHLQKSTVLRKTFGIADSDIIFLYLGGITKGRGINILLEVFAEVDSNKHVVFMGYGDLVPLVKNYAKSHANIHYHEGVNPDDIPRYASSADIGLSLIENVCMSYYFCMPNKLYEYVFSGLAVIVSDFPDMGGFVDQYGCGWKIPIEKAAISEMIETLNLKDISAKKEKAFVARKDFGWHLEEPVLLRVYQRMFGIGTWSQ